VACVAFPTESDSCARGHLHGFDPRFERALGIGEAHEASGLGGGTGAELLSPDSWRRGGGSAAAKAVTGSIAEAGWDFWGAPSGDGSYVALAKLRERLRENGSAKERIEPEAQPDNQAATPATNGAQPGTESTPPPAAPDLTSLVHREGLPLPLDLHTIYRRQRAEARIETDGSVTFGGRSFRSPSLAASAARKALGYSGLGKAETNGWTFWRYTDREGIAKKLDALRSRGGPVDEARPKVSLGSRTPGAEGRPRWSGSA
jgi:RAMA domain-containing protein